MSRNLLIIGNGFDLYHGLPTSYREFVNFASVFMSLWGGGFDGSTYDLFEDHQRRGLDDDPISSLSPQIEKDIHDLFHRKCSRENGRKRIETYNDTDMQHLYDYLNGNVWIDYFRYILKNNKQKGENWIDFEAEISSVIQFIDDKHLTLKDEVALLRNSYTREDELANKSWLQQRTYKTVKDFMQGAFYRSTDKERIDKCRTIEDLSMELWDELRNLTKAYEIYLSAFVETMTVYKKEPFISEINPDCVLSFNYTDTYRRIYDKNGGCEYCYIHGNCRHIQDLNKGKCNMILGINEYQDGDDRGNLNQFVIFQKNSQRTRYNTSLAYRKWQLQMKDDFEKNRAVFRDTNSELFEEDYSDVWIFGHSLDVTDSEVLRSIISTEFTRVHVYSNSKDEHDEDRHITNLVNIIGKKAFEDKAENGDQRLIEFC